MTAHEQQAYKQTAAKAAQTGQRVHVVVEDGTGRLLFGLTPAPRGQGQAVSQSRANVHAPVLSFPGR